VDNRIIKNYSLSKTNLSVRQRLFQ
jgi:hypothetical protein